MKQFSSFRDPSGRVVFDGEAVWRIVNNDADADLQRLLGFDIIKEMQGEGRLVRVESGSLADFARFAGSETVEDGSVLYRHPRVKFPSYPSEWAPEMLHAAGELTLDIAESLLPLNWGLKDATPYNILFDGPDPIFIDLLSFEARDSEDPIWRPYSQFVKTFLLPLLVNKKLNIPLKAVFHVNRDGLDVSEAAHYFGTLAKLSPQVLSLITLPNLLVKRAEKRADLYKTSTRNVSPDQARFILNHSFRRLRRQLRNVAPDPGRQSKWTAYTDSNRKSIPEYMSSKREFVERTVGAKKPKRVLDVGCNNGYFSFFAARSGASVVALDHDPAVIGEVWRNAGSQGLDVLPLVVDLSRPSPSLGWRNSEIPSFLDRATGQFDLVMMLAVLHHLLVQERVPLREVLALAAELTTEALIIEFVPPSDPLFRRIARGREHLHEGLTAGVFEDTAKEFFEVVKSSNLPQTDRSIYLMLKK